MYGRLAEVTNGGAGRAGGGGIGKLLEPKREWAYKSKTDLFSHLALNIGDNVR